ncbi:hypothetical protein AVO45_00950 [Ruegeria marisrubri]|uniref:VWFA domain-containing protein n=1 Tax=Ruegeria marisrubri TaxID=1685379 RepID=A0A101CY93_9RHOB|nr:DUF1194 domain-containing protein [Ruegeria marisrubri]KUJ85593.1 hypothetical protein AVO45_00950 [Ruegeria marisrubri]
MIRHLALCLCLLASPLSAQCRQALALGLDVSGSVDSREYQMQLLGLANAMQDAEVVALFLANPSAPVRLAIFEWSEAGHQRLLLPWTEISNETVLQQVSALLRTTQRTAGPAGTAVGSAMLYGVERLREQPDCWKHTLDLSGDGKHNLGPHPSAVKTRLLESGITINGLVIGADDPRADDKRQVQIGELSAYYSAWVILGPGAFVEVALGFKDYEAAMVRKLKRELESPSLSRLAHPVQAAGGADGQ